MFDLESQTTEEIHVLIIAGFCDVKNRVWRFRGKDCVTHMLNKIVSLSYGYTNVIGWAHFMKYDLYIMAKYLKINSICKKENLVYGVNICHQGEK